MLFGIGYLYNNYVKERLLVGAYERRSLILNEVARYLMDRVPGDVNALTEDERANDPFINFARWLTPEDYLDTYPEDTAFVAEPALLETRIQEVPEAIGEFVAQELITDGEAEEILFLIEPHLDMAA